MALVADPLALRDRQVISWYACLIPTVQVAQRFALLDIHQNQHVRGRRKSGTISEWGVNFLRDAATNGRDARSSSPMGTLVVRKHDGIENRIVMTF